MSDHRWWLWSQSHFFGHLILVTSSAQPKDSSRVAQYKVNDLVSACLNRLKDVLCCFYRYKIPPSTEAAGLQRSPACLESHTHPVHPLLEKANQDFPSFIPPWCYLTCLHSVPALLDRSCWQSCTPHGFGSLYQAGRLTQRDSNIQKEAALRALRFLFPSCLKRWMRNTKKVSVGDTTHSDSGSWKTHGDFFFDSNIIMINKQSCCSIFMFFRLPISSLLLMQPRRYIKIKCIKRENDQISPM